MEQNAHGGGGGRRPHYQRGRRGHDRRGSDRRTPQGAQPQANSDNAPREHREHVDVEQIMREIRSRIAKGSGVDITQAQIHELAARRLEAILDPRNVSPGLLDQLRKGAASPLEAPKATAREYSFDETTLSATESGVVRFFRRLFAPLLKVLFNVEPIVAAFRAQQEINQEAVARDAARDRRQAEWNALHYELLQKLVTDASRASLEMQSISLKVEALSAKVDFNDRRVRNMENSVHQARPQGRQQEPRERPERSERPERFERPERLERLERTDRPERQERPERAERPIEPAATSASADTSTTNPPAAGAGEAPGEGNRRRRRRRRGRRSGGASPADPSAAPSAVVAAGTADVDAEDVELDLDEGGDDEPAESAEAPSAGASIADQRPHAPSLLSAPPEAPPQAQLPPAAASSEPVAVTPDQPAPAVEPAPPRDEAIETQGSVPVTPAEQEPPER
jgi:hypothetical protein